MDIKWKNSNREHGEDAMENGTENVQENAAEKCAGIVQKNAVEKCAGNVQENAAEKCAGNVQENAAEKYAGNGKAAAGGKREKTGNGKPGMMYGLFAAVLLVGLCSAVFLAQYPQFKKNAQMRGQESSGDTNFLTRLGVSNYIFYKDIVEKVEQEKRSYYELYVDMEVTDETVPEGGMLPDSDFYTDMDGDSYEAWLSGEFSKKMGNDWGTAASEVRQVMDYCVMDHETGTFIKNTGRKIEALAGVQDRDGAKDGEGAGTNLPSADGLEDGTEKEGIQQEYVYYVMVSYDHVGNLDRVAVKDENPDELLKRVQNVMGSKPLEKWVGDITGQEGDEGLLYGCREEDGRLQTFRYRLDAPHDVTFIYAMTQQQWQSMQNNGRFGEGYSEWYNYYQSGAPEVYMWMLFLLAVAGLVLMRCRWYGLHRLRAVEIPLEISVLAVPVWFAAFSWWLLELVVASCTGDIHELYAGSMAYLPVQYYDAVTLLLNACCVFLLFGGWFYVVNSFGGVFVLGVKGFLAQRSLTVKLGMWIWEKLERYYGRFKQEMLHVDLGENAIKTVRKVVITNFLLIGVMCSMWVFGWTALVCYSVALYFILKKYVHRLQMQYAKMLEAANSIAEGNLHTVFDEDLGVFESYKKELYRIQEGFRKAVDEEVKSQRMKTELIANVSHDLKTPLTAITTYIDLLKEENVSGEQRKEYLAVLEKKSLRLKTLIEDLFEVSKADSRNVTVNLVDVDICNLMRQVYLEYEESVEEANLIFRFRMPQEKVILKLDSQKTYRIFENLYSNIIKYAMTGTRVYVDVEREENAVRIGLKNISATELHVQADELTERFVRGDSSRNTEGSGLGLAIAKSFVQIQGGRMEVTVDGDLFKVTIWF